VYKAKMGQLDVAVKTIHRQHVNPQLTSHQALQVMQKVNLTVAVLLLHDALVKCSCCDIML